jgi:hypothetical protein
MNCQICELHPESPWAPLADHIARGICPKCHRDLKTALAAFLHWAYAEYPGISIPITLAAVLYLLSRSR